MARTDSGLALIQLHVAQNAFVKALGMTLTIYDEGVVSYALNINPSHLATPGFVHGGVLTTLLDATMGAGALTLVADEGRVVSTIEMQTNFISAGKINNHLIATSKLIRKGKKVIFMQAEIRNDQDHLIAIANGSFYPFAAESAGYILTI
jgi:acyl-CoA thioesterase